MVQPFAEMATSRFGVKIKRSDMSALVCLVEMQGETSNRMPDKCVWSSEEMFCLEMCIWGSECGNGV